MAHYELTPPVSEAQVRALAIHDTVTLQSTLFGVRDATLIHLFDRGRRTRFDLAGHAVIHTAPNVKPVPKSVTHPAGYAPVCVGTTTSDRMERFTRPLMRDYGVRIIVGKGGLRDESLQAFRDLGGAYLAVIGGTAALETTWVEQIEDVDLDDLIPNRCEVPAPRFFLGRSWSPWTATAVASTPTFGTSRSAPRACSPRSASRR
jgi:L(+)-tartrate dehydratase beta subunit